MSLPEYTYFYALTLFNISRREYVTSVQKPKSMKQPIPSRSLHFIALCLLALLSFGELAAQQTKGTTSIILAGLQMNVTNNLKTNQEQIIAGIHKAAAEGASFLVTPEGSLSGYTSNFDRKELISALNEVTAEAARMKVGLLLGTCYKELKNDKEFCFNQVRAYTSDGLLFGTYSKILRCSSLDLPGSGEMVDYVEGEIKTFDWNGFRFGILICNDLWAHQAILLCQTPIYPGN